MTLRLPLRGPPSGHRKMSLGPDTIDRAPCYPCLPKLATHRVSPSPQHRPGETERTVAERLVVRGAREHNLKDVSLDLPRDAMIVFTGLSGSGKSSLAFDTIMASLEIGRAHV